VWHAAHRGDRVDRLRDLPDRAGAAARVVGARDQPGRYGVRLLHARDEASLEAITRSLETAWRDGQVELTLLQGRTALAVAA
jgi:hypothetical protein